MIMILGFILIVGGTYFTIEPLLNRNPKTDSYFFVNDLGFGILLLVIGFAMVGGLFD